MKDKSHRMKKAVGVGYDMQKDRAPKVIAKGSGFIAKKIIEIAKEHGIPIYEDSDLIELLSGVDLYREIPSKAYQAIAEILAFIYTMNNIWKERRGELNG